MMTQQIILVAQTPARNAYGDTTYTQTRKSVFAEVMSIGQKEFYQAKSVGLQPELKFRLQDYLDYSGEQIVEHDGSTYRVLRTYRTGNSLELTVYRENNPA